MSLGLVSLRFTRSACNLQRHLHLMMSPIHLQAVSVLCVVIIFYLYNTIIPLSVCMCDSMIVLYSVYLFLLEYIYMYVLLIHPIYYVA